jgi:hypothetical protein
MSLINDALRRAKQVQDHAPALPPPPPLNPVEPPPYLLRGTGIVVPVALTAVALVGLLLLWQVYQRNSLNTGAAPVAHSAAPQHATAATDTQVSITPPPNANPNPSAPKPSVAEMSKAPGSPAPVASPNSGAPADGSTTVSTTNVAAASTGTNVAIAPPSEAPKPPPLTLQGIVFNPRRPSVVINGKTLFVGDRIGQFRVAAIKPDSATLIGSGRTNLLSLDQ